MYFVDTARMHYLFKVSFESHMIVTCNAILNKTTVDYVISKLKVHVKSYD